MFCVSRATVRCPPRSYSQHAVAPTTRRPVSKPKARTPKGADGAPCDWDERDGCWRESDGTPFDPKRGAAASKKTRQREAQSEASKRAEREAQAAAQRKLWDNLSAEQRRERCDRSAAAHRKTRGVTPLKQALMLPTGQ